MLISIGLSPIASKNIIVDIKDIQSAVSLHSDDIGDENLEGNLVLVEKHIDEATGELVQDDSVFTLPGDAFRDKVYLDWII